MPDSTPRASTPRPGAPAPWSAEHLGLHRLLRRQPALLPAGATLLVAVSGGQDSMALLGLLRDLRRLHGWALQLWHGDHGWRNESGLQARELAAWAAGQGLPLTVEHWTAGENAGEAAAREWRYGRLTTRARRLGAARVVTGHTASDRAETLLFNLLRGCHRRGMGSLRELRPLGGGLMLARPLLGFTRADTARLCQQLALPVWVDPSNAGLEFSRNRLRHAVLPVLEELHPGAERRIGSLAGQLADEDDARQELVSLALRSLGQPSVPGAVSLGLPLAPLKPLQRANQAALLQHWLEGQCGRRLSRRSLECLLDRLAAGTGDGRFDLAGGWRLWWQRSTLFLASDSDGPSDDGHP